MKGHTGSSLSVEYLIAIKVFLLSNQRSTHQTTTDYFKNMKRLSVIAKKLQFKSLKLLTASNVIVLLI